jgi:uncharacterized protein
VDPATKGFLAVATSLTALAPGTLALLILQPTPFCNLDCRYCYLPSRDNRARMSIATLESALRRIGEAHILGDVLSVVWHAGEPLAVSRAWYAEAFSTARNILPADLRIDHHFQTNGTLVNDLWCDFILQHGIRVGVSIDGPAKLHDANRRTRDGEETHGRVLAGVHRLQAAGIPVHAICVLTRAHLDYPDAIFDFFVDQGIREVDFNIEEVDGINQTTSLFADDSLVAFRRFFARIVERYREDPTRLAIREIGRVVEALMDPGFGTQGGNAQTVPLAMLNIAWDGSIGTFSPELLGTAHERYGQFRFGNVATETMLEVLNNPRLQKISAEIRRGVKRCRACCPYFAFCRGGAPSNKLGETGRFDSTTTIFCTITQKLVVETVLAALEEDLNPAKV